MATANIDSTRVFVSGLPRSLTSEQLASHFGHQYHVTDAHVLPDRRIGFVGFKDHSTAQDAARHFNRSFIRMSKIAVDLARPVGIKQDHNGHAVPISNRSRRDPTYSESIRNPRSSRDLAISEQKESLSPASKKRKRDAIDDDGSSRTAHRSEYLAHKRSSEQPESSGKVETVQNPSEDDENTSENVGTAENDHTSDGDWLRGKTSRILDLVEPGEDPKENPSSTDLMDVAPTEEQKDLEADSVSDEQAADSDELLLTQKVPNARLFIRNLSFDVTEGDLVAKFGEFGKIQEAHVVLDARSSQSKGLAFLQYSNSESATKALQLMDGVAFHGRLIHVLPASDKRDTGLTDYDLSKMPLKKQKAIKRKLGASSSTFSWNSLYMNPDSVIASIANRLGVSKSDVLDPTSSDAAIKQAHAETQVIAETKEFLRSQGVNVDAFKTKARDDRVILLKNFPFGTTDSELKDLLEPFGHVTRFLQPPTGTMAIAQYAESYSASQALKGLSYKNVKGSVLYLERAPQGLLASSPPEPAISNDIEKLSATGPSEQQQDTPASATTSTVFIRNLNFDTSTNRLMEVFGPLSGFLSARVKTRTDPKRPGQILSMGFGFAEFRTKADADAGIRAINGYRLDGHELIAKLSTKETDVAEERRRNDQSKKADASKTKIVIKNLPFEASKKDIRSLFSQYGQLKTVRLPKKFNNTSRGFAFAEFVTAKEAANAIQSLSDTHLLGRRLVLDFVEEETVDAEEQIRATEKKIEQQSNRVNLSKLTGPGRRKFNLNLEGDDDA